MESKKSIRRLQLGLASFFILLLICIIIRPAGLVVNSGISYYGNYLDTLLPFMLAFFINSYLLWRTASIIGGESKIDVYFRFVLKLTAILMIGIALTPHDVFGQTIFNFAHRIIGTTLFSFQIVMATVIAVFVYRNWLNIFLLVLLFVSGYAALIYLLQPDGFMIEAQIVFQISIWVLFIRYLNYDNSRLDNEASNKIRK